TVVGVLPPAFAVMEPGVEVFIPLGLNPSDTRTANARVLTVIARRRGPLEQVRAELDAVGAQMERSLPALDKGWRPSVFELGDELVSGVRQALWVLMAAVGCLLLMACVNVANLLLARGATRRKEIALRCALGAGRGRIVAQLLSESVLLALGGGALGLLLAAGAIYVLAHGGPAGVPRLAQAALDLRVFGFALGVSLVTGILFGLAPGMQASGSGLSMTLKEGGRGGTAGRAGRRMRNALAIAEVALAVVVLIGAGLLIRSFIRLRGVDPGFRPAGVRAVGAVNVLPLTGLGVGATFAVEGRPPPSAEQRPLGLMRSVNSAYFGAMGIPLVAGRAPADSDTALSPPVIVVNQTLARRFWPGPSAIGGRLAIDQIGGRVAEIVGVVGDVKPDRINGAEWPTIYVPYAQGPAAAMTLAVRTAGAPLGLASAV